MSRLSERMRGSVAWVGKDAEKYPTGEHLTRADMVLEWADEVVELEGLLQLAAGYLEHPDVQVIPFALPSGGVAKRLRAAARLPSVAERAGDD